MPASHPRFRALAVGVAAFALVSVAAGGTLAASTNPPTLYACFNTSGQVAMATIPQCKLTGGGQLAYWGTAGIPGPTGPQGATGAMGSTGPTGPTGPGGPIAFAHIDAGGNLTFNSGVASVDHGATGRYCVHPTSGQTPSDPPSIPHWVATVTAGALGLSQVGIANAGNSFCLTGASWGVQVAVYASDTGLPADGQFDIAIFQAP
jgi:hypothetical protein